MNRTSRCIVRNCGNKADRYLCEVCTKMMITGTINMSSSAWFVTEIMFMAQQNDQAMIEVAHLHKRVNELSDD